MINHPTIKLRITAAILILAPHAFAAVPRDAVPLDVAEPLMNYRLHVEFSAAAEGAVRLSKDIVVPLPKGVEHDVALEHPAKGAPVLRVWTDGKLVRGPEEVPGLSRNDAQDFPEAKIDLGADFTAVAKFDSSGGGTLFSSSPGSQISPRRTCLAACLRWDAPRRILRAISARQHFQRADLGPGFERSLHGTIHHILAGQ